MFLSNISGLGLADIGQALSIIVHDTIIQPVSLYWVLAIFIGFLVFTDTYSRLYRLIAGSIHALTHLSAFFFVSWGASFLISGGKGLILVLTANY